MNPYGSVLYCDSITSYVIPLQQVDQCAQKTDQETWLPIQTTAGYLWTGRGTCQKLSGICVFHYFHFTTPTRTRGTRWSRSLSLEVITYVVSRDDHVRRLSRWSRTSSLAMITYVVSRGDHVRRFSRWSRTSFLAMITYVVSRDDHVRAGMYVRDVLLEVLAWRPFCLLPLRF